MPFGEGSLGGRDVEAIGPMPFNKKKIIIKMTRRWNSLARDRSEIVRRMTLVYAKWGK